MQLKRLSLTDPKRRPLQEQYGVAFISLTVATLIHGILSYYLNDTIPFVTYFLAIIVAGWFGGKGAAIAVTFASALLSKYLFFESRFTYSFNSTSELVSSCVFIIGGLSISWFFELLHRAIFSRDEISVALLESETRFQVMADGAPVLIWVVDKSSNYIYFNKPWLDFTGRTQEQEYGQGWREGIHADDVGQCLKVFRESFESRKSFKIEYRLRRIDGQYRWILENGVPRFGKDNVFLGFIGSCIDIDDKKKAMIALAESESRFRFMADHAPVLIWMSDETSHCSFLNKVWLDFTGRSADEQYGQGWEKSVHPDDFAHLMMIYLNAFKERKQYHVEFRLKRADGQYRWLYNQGIPRYDQNGNFLGYIGSCINIHDRIEMEEKIIDQQEFLQTLIDAVPACVCYVDERHHYILVNDAYRIWHQKPALDIMGHHISEILGEEGYKQILPRMNLAFTGVAQNFETYINYPSKSRWVSVSYIPVKNDQERISGIVVHVFDISDRKNLENSLRESRAEYHDLINSIPQIIWKIEDNDTMSYCNEWGRQYCGLNHAMDWMSVIHPEDLGDFKMSRMNLKENLKPFKMECRILRASDRLFRWHMCSAVMMSDQPQEGRTWLITSIDIHAQKEAEILVLQTQQTLADHAKTLEDKVLERTAKLRELNQEMELFTYSISHDFQAPLRYINGFTDAIMADNSSNISEASQEYILHISRTAKRMSQLIKDLLVYSRLTRIEVVMETLSLDEAVNALIQEHKSVIQKTNAQIIVKSPLHQIKGHILSLSPALSNLFLNSLKFRSKERAVQIIFYSEIHDDKVRLWIVDNGIGIDPQYHHKIFKMFERLNEKTAYPGSGIGLNIVRKCLEKIDATLGLESELGVGCRFWIDFQKADTRTSL